jgi:uncharacterized tellurite resistance protein B-like protein
MTDDEPGAFAEGDCRVAAAALLVHLVNVDGIVTAAEKACLHDLLKTRFGLDERQTGELIAQATRAEGEAIDLYHFTRRLNRALDAEGKRRVVEMMWEIIYADRRLNEFEDNVVWRVADLLGVSSRERIELRRKVEAARTDVEAAD